MSQGVTAGEATRPGDNPLPDWQTPEDFHAAVEMADDVDELMEIMGYHEQIDDLLDYYDVEIENETESEGDVSDEWTSPGDVSVDDLDREILNILEEDGRTSFAAIGRELDVSTPTASTRIEQLVEKGVIEGFSVEVNRRLMDPVEVSQRTLERLLAHARTSRIDRGTCWHDEDEAAYQEATRAIEEADR